MTASEQNWLSNSLSRRLTAALLALLLCGWGASAMALTQTSDPTDCRSRGNNSLGNAWSNSSQAETSDNNFASVTVGDSTQSRYLECTGYDFNLPADATITGITVSIERGANYADVRDSEVRIVRNGNRGTANRAKSTLYPVMGWVWPDFGERYEDYGGGTDLWGETWTVAQINANDFGVALRSMKAVADGQWPTIYVDNIRITVTYSSPSSVEIINTYYPGTASVSAGATSISLGAATGSSATIQTGDLVLVMQMQDAQINFNNDATYGDGAAGDPGSGSTATRNSGLFEYAVAQNNIPLSGGTLQLSCGLINAYTNAAADWQQGQRRFQVIRVPVYANYSLAGLTALAWNGTTGGVLAFDVTGTLNLSSRTINVNGKGFRGGAGRGSGTGSGAYTDYRTPASNGANGSKGEGIAGTPDYVFTAPSTRTTTGTSYPSGSFARGAPGNGGGGGTDRHPSANDENSGGGGGGNGGSGGIGGIGWCGSFTNTAPYWGCGYSGLVSAVNPNGSTGGFGGAAVSSLGATRLTLGGGGGAATSNNSTGDLGALSSSGAAGGGIIMIRAGTMTGTATFNANGSDGDNTVGNDGSGGGGAGGAVLISAGSGMNGVTINVRGGTGGSNLVPSEGYTSDPHGPGGGGGGGYAITSGATASCTASGGASGVTYRQGNSFGAYGAQAGSTGGCATSLTSGSIPGSGLGGIPACPSALDHFGIDVGGGSASTCAPKAIAISARDAADNVLTNYTGSVGLSTSSGHGDWLASDGVNVNPDPPTGTLTNGTANDGAATYAFASGDNGTVTLYLDNHHADDLTITVNDAGEGVSTTSAALAFRDNAFVITPVTCTGTTCTAPASGSTEVVAGRDHTFNITMSRRDPSTGVCATATAYAADNVALKFWITRDTDDPAGTAPSVDSASLPNTAPGSNNVTTLDFVAGESTFVLATTDVGKYTINVRDDTSGFAKETTGTARAISGASASLTVRPFALGFTNIVSGATTNPGGTASGGGKFIPAGETFSATVGGYLYDGAEDSNSDGVANATANVTDNGLTPAFAWTTSLGLSPAFTPSGTGAALGTLGATPAPPAVDQSVYTDGEGSNATLTYSEVGSIMLTAMATDYLNSSGVTVSGTSGTVGRFYPHHFTVSSGTVTPFCSTATGFTYMGQPFLLVRYTVTAHNASGSRTANYGVAQEYGSDLMAAPGLVAENNDDGIELTTRLDGTPAIAPAWAAGDYSYTNTNLTFSRGSEPDGPFDTLQLGVVATDDDGATIAATDMRADTAGNCAGACNAHTVGNATSVRYGRARLINANGSELLDLRVPFVLQYYTANGFVLNGDDLCSDNVSLAKSNATEELSEGEVCAWDGGSDSGISCGSTVVAGRDFSEPPTAATPGDFNLWIRAPGVGNTGSMTLNATVPDWLRYDWNSAILGDENPSGRVSFGIYTGSPRHIYMRELY